jgi:hypothetical protein
VKSDTSTTVEKNEKRILEALSRGLSTEFPNPERVGCPGSATLEGMAWHSIPLSEAEKWLDHLGSCSPCFLEFTAIRNRLRGRRRLKWGGGLALLFVGLALWLSFRSHPVLNETSVLDLRAYPVQRGGPNPPSQTPLQIGRGTRRLTVDLPVGSKEGSYDLTLLNDRGSELLHVRGTAQLESHVMVLRVDLKVADVPAGSYFLGLRQPGLEWTRFPVRVF